MPTGGNPGGGVGAVGSANGGMPTGGNPGGGVGAVGSADGGAPRGGNPSGTIIDTQVIDLPDGISDASLATSHLSAVWANEGADKVTRDELRATSGRQVTNSAWDGNKVVLFGARNEVVSFNLVLEAADKAVDDVGVSFDTLTGPNGSVIQSRNAPADGLFDWIDRPIELFYLRYLQIKGLSRTFYETYDERHVPMRFRRPWTGDGNATGGWTDRPDHDKFYPDIAVPLELVPRFTTAAGQNQSVWVDIHIPKDTQPGLHTGTAYIWEGDQPTVAIPVELTVLNFALPDEPNAKTMLFSGHGDVNHRYIGEDYPDEGTPNGTLAQEIRARHFMVAHRHRISMIGDPADPGDDKPGPGWTSILDGSLFTAANGYDGPGVGTGNGVYSIGTYGAWTWKSEGEAGMHAHADAWVNWFDANEPNAEYFLYLIDESSDYAQTENWAQWLAGNQGPGGRLKSMATLRLPEAIANTPSLDNVTSVLGVGDADTWEQASRTLISNPDKRLYLYNGSRPSSGTFATEDDGIALREMSWSQYKKGIQRWFFWESTYYNDNQGGRGEQNVFQSAQTFGGSSTFDSVRGETGWNHNNGDGVLFYPGKDLVFPQDSYGVMGPFASLRLKHWRRGIQDVDYLTMAAERDPNATRAIVERMVPKVLWEYGVADPTDPTWVRSDISWSNDPNDWEIARRELAEIITGK